MSEDNAFWKVKALSDLSKSEWEQLCDGCGRCCLVKLEDEDTGDIYTTSVACRLFDSQTCRCKDYENRFKRVSDCLNLELSLVGTLNWLPATCAYRLRHEGKQLPGWHPLNSGSTQSVVDAGISVAGGTFSEDLIAEEDLGNYLHEWPNSGENAPVSENLKEKNQEQGK